jgi:hypothetical protein
VTIGCGHLSRSGDGDFDAYARQSRIALRELIGDVLQHRDLARLGLVALHDQIDLR